jgi:hypothetical protein
MSTPPNDIISEHAALIGRVAIAWNDLNHVLSFLFRLFSGMPEDKATAVYLTPKSDSTQRQLLKAVAQIALEPHPEIWQAFKKSLDSINALAGERNAAIHTSWAVQFPEPKFVPAASMPLHGALKPDFITQFEALRDKLSDEFFALNEVRTAFEQYSRGRHGDLKRLQIRPNRNASDIPVESAGEDGSGRKGGTTVADEPKGDGPTDAEIGLLDALTTVMEIFLALGIEPEYLATPLRAQRDGQRAAGRPSAAAVLDILLDYVSDPELARWRRNLRLIQQEPPKGTA